MFAVVLSVGLVACSGEAPSDGAVPESTSPQPIASESTQPESEATESNEVEAGCSDRILERYTSPDYGDTRTEVSAADLVAYLGFDVGQSPSCVLQRQMPNGGEQWDAWFTDSTPESRAALAQSLFDNGVGYDGTADDFLSQTGAAFNKDFWKQGSPTLYGTIYWGSTGPSFDDTALLVLVKR